MTTYDVAVVGLGGIGSAVLAECARRGASAIGVEQHQRGHELGSSSGKTRLFRKAYFEDARYVPLLHRAEEGWRRLEKEADCELLDVTGLLLVGDKESELLGRSYRAAREHQLPVKSLSAAEVRMHYPKVKLLENEVAIYEPAAGVLKPERGIEAHLHASEVNGATLRFDISMQEWRNNGSVIVATLSDRSTIRSRAIVLALGPWFKREMEEIGIPLRIQRNVQAWFKPSVGSFSAKEFPAFLLDRGNVPFYGFPDFGDGIKVAFHGRGELTAPDQVERSINYENDIEPLAKALGAWVDSAEFRFCAAKVCMYSLTPDENFIIDRHPAQTKVILCGGFSGHGYKFAPVIGEIAADLALEGTTRHDIEFLSIARFTR